MSEYGDLLLEHQEYIQRLAILYEKRERLNSLIIDFEKRKGELAMMIGEAAIRQENGREIIE